MPILEIDDLHAGIDGQPILTGINLSVEPGEVHAIMGPNGSGKSTLAGVLSGREEFEVTRGSVTYMGQNLLEMDPEMRARKGVFLAFQYPVSIPGVTNSYFLKAALNAVRKERGEPELDVVEFLQLIKSKMGMVDMDEELLKRQVNVGFSGGEKKRNEIFQMAVLEPQLGVLDETDSGLDIDALQTVANGVNQLRDGKRSFIVITHYQRILNYIVPDRVHVLMNGRIIQSGERDLALKLEEKGYSWLEEQVAESGTVPA